jgi:hypothetical protein
MRPSKQTKEKKTRDVEVVFIFFSLGLQEFKASGNGEGHCKFHPGLLTRQSHSACQLSCCRQTLRGEIYDENVWKRALSDIAGCKKGRHAAAHHQAFPYLGFMVFCRVNYLSDKWLENERNDLTPDSEAASGSVSVGTNSHGQLVVRHYLQPNPVFAHVVAPDQWPVKLSEADNAIAVTEAHGWLLRSSWLVEGGAVVGVETLAKAPSDDTPSVITVRVSVASGSFVAGEQAVLRNPDAERPTVDPAHLPAVPQTQSTVGPQNKKQKNK